MGRQGRSADIWAESYLKREHGTRWDNCQKAWARGRVAGDETVWARVSYLFWVGQETLASTAWRGDRWEHTYCAARWAVYFSRHLVNSLLSALHRGWALQSPHRQHPHRYLQSGLGEPHGEFVSMKKRSLRTELWEHRGVETRKKEWARQLRARSQLVEEEPGGRCADGAQTTRGLNLHRPLGLATCRAARPAARMFSVKRCERAWWRFTGKWQRKKGEAVV